MKISRLRVSNYRNLTDIDIPLTGSAVLVGENASGKSNLLHALRLVLDPSLSARQRTLTSEEFSESLGADPMGDGAVIEVSVDVEGFEQDPGLVATLAQALIDGEPMCARLTYRFGPRPGQEGEHPPAYEASIYGGDNPDRRIGGELRTYLHHVHMHALRDAEGDIASWRRSPLRPLLEEISRSTTPEDLAELAESLQAASETARGLPAVGAAASAIESQTAALVGQLHRLEPTLDLAPADPERTLRSLRLYLDGAAQRSLSSASLGSLNVLYIALLQLELARLLGKGEIEHALISIEEPEAHLHPHLQRRMFASLLADENAKLSTIVSTHSPHIVSVTPPKQLIVLREVDGSTHPHAAGQASLSDREWDDLGRYLDATRSELVFARRVLLVEGFAEQVLLPRLAAGTVDLDEHGVSVCVIHGTHFLSYVRFLRELGTPYAVITDGDPDAGTGRTGADRIQRLADVLTDDDEEEEEEEVEVEVDPETLGLFCGDDTFETDLYETSQENRATMIDALLSFPFRPASRARIEAAHADGMSSEQFLGYVERVSKGRYAQRLSTADGALEAPPYLQQALAHVMA
jgi:putative ATP-dependent endonuclease of the OLD family